MTIRVESDHIAAHARGVTSRLWDGLSTTERNSILACASYRRVPAHCIIVNAGDPAEYFFLLIKGQARYFLISEDGKEISLMWLAPGEIFGGSALLPVPLQYLASTEIVRDGTVAAWKRATVRGLAAKYPRLLENALSIATDYFTWFIAAHVALTCDNARQRLARVLLSLAAGLGHKDHSGGVLLNITNEQLANASNITPFTASRLLSEWRRAGLLDRKRGAILLYRPDLLH